MVYSDKTIAIVGASDEEVARLCAQIRKAAAKLDHRWRWGTETAADLIVADPLTLAGEMARVRARASGRRCAVICDRAADSGSDIALVRPVQAERLVGVLSWVADTIAAPPEIAPQRYDIDFRDLLESRAANDSSARSSNIPERASVMVGLEEYLRSDPRTAAWIDRPVATLTIAPPSNPRAASERTLARTLKFEGPLKIERSTVSPLPRKPRLAVPATPTNIATRIGSRASGRVSPQTRLRERIDIAPHTLWAYLTGNLLGKPARIKLPDAPALTLDPINRVYHSEGNLRDLGKYCAVVLRRSAWHELSPAELASVRKALPAQTYQKLLWLDALRNCSGRLAPHLDPAGTYRLLRWLDIDMSYPRHFRIATAMVKPGKLHEIAAESEAPMADVFDTVDAFDAIGYLEWTRRTSRDPMSRT
ncbi:MAG: hypothetical protein ABI451_06270, partial [Dokdonella sp.]